MMFLLQRNDVAILLKYKKSSLSEFGRAASALFALPARLSARAVGVSLFGALDDAAGAATVVADQQNGLDDTDHAQREQQRLGDVVIDKSHCGIHAIDEKEYEVHRRKDDCSMGE